MNRYVITVILAGLMVVILSALGGVSRLLSDDSRVRDDLRANDSTLGTVPIEQAGRIIQRQSQATPGAPETPVGTGNFGGSGSSFRSSEGIERATPNTTMSPTNVNGASRTSQPGPISTTGDISPIKPDLVRPETVPPTADPNLDSIPALW